VQSFVKKLGIFEKKYSYTSCTFLAVAYRVFLLLHCEAKIAPLYFHSNVVKLCFILIVSWYADLWMNFRQQQHNCPLLAMGVLHYLVKRSISQSNYSDWSWLKLKSMVSWQLLSRNTSTVKCLPLALTSIFINHTGTSVACQKSLPKYCGLEDMDNRTGRCLS